MLMLAGKQRAYAQNEALDTINLQLRQLFSPLLKPANPKKFLYDMAVHVTDSIYYQVNCPDTNNTDVFQRVYEEMYHAAYDTTQLTPPDEFFEAGMSFTNDTIPIGIINYSYYLLKPDALTTNTYFDFDTINTTLTDKTIRPGYPYNESSIFIAAPLVGSTHFANPVFRVDPQFILYDHFNNPTTNSTQLQIDFGDGNGWVNFDHTVITHHNVTYTATSTMTIRTRMQTLEADAPTSISLIINPTLLVTTPPDVNINFPGINASLFRSCNSNFAATGRTIIYLEGIDMLDFIPSARRTPEQIFASQISDNQVIQLRNNGYDFLVVSWQNSKIDMRFNALYLVNMLQQLKTDVINNGFNEQFVIMGESMGGVIARYALTYMESNDYQNQNTNRFFADEFDINNLGYLAANPVIFTLPTNWNNPDAMHHTRLFISLDAPQQGANIPIAFQKAYQHAFNIYGRFIGMGLRTTAKMFNLFLDGQAAQQLLLYHVDTEAGSGFYKTYSRHPDGDNFYQDLRQEGNGYPTRCKVVLMSSGALNGIAQQNFYTNTPRVANDRLLDFEAELYGRVLGIKIPIFGGSLKLNTNPNGNGQVFQANAGSYGIRIKLRWFGIKINIGYNTLLFKTDYANTLPYCTSAGGFTGNTTLLSNSPTNDTFALSNKWLFNLFSYNFTRDANGCTNLVSHIGLNGFLSANFDFSLCSDGFHFALVPLQSALDYGNVGSTPALGFDIENNHNTTTKLGNVPVGVDVIIGNTDPGTSTTNINRNHLNFRNDNIRNLTGLNATNPQPGTGNTSVFENTYHSCISANNQFDRVRRGFLNLEIGDEELYLENNNLAWNATYVTEYDLHVNDRNPNYEYPSQSNPILLGIYSKEADFNIENTAFATFVYDAANTPTGIGFNFTNPNGNFGENNQPLVVCCEDYAPDALQSITVGSVPTTGLLPQATKGFIKVYPNPNKGQQAIVKYKFIEAGKVTLSLYNSNGQQLLQQALPIPNALKEVTTVIDLYKLRVKPGMYLIRMHNNKESLTTKIIVTN